MIEKAFKLGFAFGKGYSYSLSKRGMAMDSWGTLQNKEGENYRVDLPGDNPNRKDSEKKSENKPKHELKEGHVSTPKEYEITGRRAFLGAKQYVFKTSNGEEKRVPRSFVTTNSDETKIVGYDPNHTTKEFFESGGESEPKKAEPQKTEVPKATGLSAGKENLLKKGREWTGGNNRRTYIDRKDLADMIGLKIETYKSGAISSAEYDGEKISNNKAYKMLSSLDKTYFDHNTGKLVTNSSLAREAFEKL